MEHVNEFELEYRNGTSGVKYFFRGPKIDWGVLRFHPGEKLGAHFHERVEETFYFTKGAPLMQIGDREFRVRPGDAFRIDPSERHEIINDTNEDVEAVFIKSVYDPKDKVAAE